MVKLREGIRKLTYFFGDIDLFLCKQELISPRI